MPILVATRNDALAGIVASCPPERRQDLVFMQNGMLEPWLREQGLADATQLLVYFAVAKVCAGRRGSCASPPLTRLPPPAW